MKFLFVISVLTALISCVDIEVGPNEEEDQSTAIERQYYQLKEYTMQSSDQVQVVDKYLKDAFLPGLKRLDIRNVGVFKLRPNASDTLQKTLVLIPFTDMDQFITLDDKLSSDQIYLEAGHEYIQATHEQAPYQRIESTILQAFTDMPMMQVPMLDGPRTERIYELRSYESATEKLYENKVDMFNAGGEIKLFDRLAFNAVFYGEVISGSKMPNLMYMTTFSDQSSRDKLWEEFFASAEWKDLKANPKYDNNVSHADIIFLFPTEYSDY